MYQEKSRVESFPQYRNHGEITEIEFKTENMENHRKQHSCDSKTNKQQQKKICKKIIVLRYFKVNFII